MGITNCGRQRPQIASLWTNCGEQRLQIVMFLFLIQLFISKRLQNGHKMTILLTLVMNSLHKYYCDIAVIMTGFGFTKLTAHFLRYLDSQKSPNFRRIRILRGPNLRRSSVYIYIIDYLSEGLNSADLGVYNLSHTMLTWVIFCLSF